MKYELNATVTISISTIVEAETLKEAIEIAESRGIEVAHNWDSETQSEDVWVSSDFDGEPQNIHESK